MQTQPYSLAVERFAALTGIQDLTSIELAWFRSGFNRRARMAYNAATYWPRFLVNGQKRVVGSYGLVSWESGIGDTIDTVLRVTRDAPFRSKSAGDYEWVANGEGIRVLRCPDSERGYLSNVYDATGEDSKVVTPKVRFASASFWFKGTQVVEDELQYLSVTDPIGGANGNGGITLFKQTGDVTLSNQWFTSEGTSVTWYVDGVNVGVDFGVGDAGVDVTAYLDGEWHLAVGVINDSTRSQLMTAVQVGDLANDLDVELADIRFHSQYLSQNDSLELYNRPDSLTGSEVWIHDTTPVYATFLADFGASYGGESGDVQQIPREWFEYCVHGAYADWLRAEGQADKAMAEDGFANGLLLQELDRMERSGRGVTPKFSTHNNRSGRA